MFQGYALFPHKLVGSNVGFGLQMEYGSKKERIAETFELVDMLGYGDRYPSELSGDNSSESPSLEPSSSNRPSSSSTNRCPT